MLKKLPANAGVAGSILESGRVMWLCLLAKEAGRCVFKGIIRSFTTILLLCNMEQASQVVQW